MNDIINTSRFVRFLPILTVIVALAIALLPSILGLARSSVVESQRQWKAGSRSIPEEVTADWEGTGGNTAIFDGDSISNENIPIDELTILGTVDGFLHGVDRASNRLLWSTSTGKPMLGTTVAAAEKTILSSDDRVIETIIPTIDGNVMIHGGRHPGSHSSEDNESDSDNGEDDNGFFGSNTMRKTSVTARVLTENAPFISQDGVLFTGQKSTSLFGLDLDLHTGDLLSSVGSGSSSSSSSSGASLDHSHDSIDKRNAVMATTTRSSELAAAKKTNMLWLGRIDYGLRATNMHSGQKHFDLTYAEWQPLSSSVLPEITDGKGGSGALKNSDFSIVSTPQGELFFADPVSGEVLTNKHGSPLNLKSPVISAFSVKRGNKRDRSGYHSMKDGTFSISSLKVRHRFAPLPATELLSDRTTVGAAGDEEREVAKITAPGVIAENIEPGSVLIVQSSQGIHSDGMLFAIEVPTTPIVPTASVVEQQPYLLPSSSDDGRQWGLEKNDGMKKTETGSMTLHPDSSLDLDISSGRIADVLGTATTIKPALLGTSPPSLQAVKSSIAARQQQKKTKMLPQRLNMNSVAEEQSMELAQVLNDYTAQSDDDYIIAELERSDYFEDSSDFYANEDDDYVGGHSIARPPPLRPQELLEDVLLLPDSGPSSSVLRQGRYRIHSDPYNGGMLTPSQQLLMENILLTKSLNQLQSEIDNRLPQTDDEFHSDGGDFPPTFALFRLFFNKKAFLKNIVQATQVLQIFFLALMLLVVSLLVILLFGVAVANLSVPYAVVLAKYPVLQQLFVLVGRPLIVILHFLQLDFLAVGAVRSLLSSDALSSSTAALSSPSRMGTKSRSDSATLSVDYDESGRKVTRVGSLAIYETVLGYGSHGTVVFKGSLNGRPVAIKRMLSQFNKAADREISLLIKSDGHPNVVRYFLKEQKSDFVYLALQLCEMSLKDFIVKVRCNKAVPNNWGEEDTKPEQVTDDVRSSLLQIAQGIAHLHAQRIVHRDIKPHNILCANPNENPYGNNSAPSSSATSDESKGSSTASPNAGDGDGPGEEPVSLRHLQRYVLKISDMGLSKQLDKDENSFSSYSYVSMSLNSSAANNGAVAAALNSPVGTIGWQAPELMAKRYTSNSPPSPTYSISSSNDSFTDEAGLALLEDELARELEDEDIDRVETITDDVALSILSDDAHPLAAGDNSSSSVSVYKKSRKERQRKIAELLALRQKRKKTQTVDIFSLGCVFFYVLTLGEHPYGQWFEREVNIMTSKVDLSMLSTMGLQDAVNLVSKMLQADPLDRPTAAEVCLHHFFWSAAKRLEFLVEFSDRLEQEPPTSVLVMAVESNAMTIIGSNCSGKWDRKLDATLLEDMGKYRKYDTSSVRDLLRVVRNKRHHYHELSPSVKAMVGALPVGFCSYFEARFPLLLSHCVDIAKKYLHSDRLFSMLFYRDTLLRPVETNSCDSSKKFSSGSSIVSPNPSSKAGDAVGDSNQPSDALASHDDADGEKSSYNYNNHSSQSSDSGNTTSSSSTAAAVCVDGVVVWHGSVLQQSLKSKGWWRDSEDWAAGSVSAAGGGVIASGSKKNRPSHLVKAAADLKYRTRLCTHWETTGGSTCPMRKKGKCIFAHGPIELRVKETRRDRWGLCNSTTASSSVSGSSAVSTSAPPATTSATPADTVVLMRFSGGEDVLGAARQIEKVRHHEGSISEFEKQSSPPPHSHMNHFNTHNNNHNSSSNTISNQHGRPHMGPGGVPTHPMYYHPQNMSTFYAQNNFGR